MASHTTSEEVDRLRELGNQEFKRGKYRRAINLYTTAIENTPSTTPIETQRTILANRAQAYVLYGNIHDALRDVDHALSSQYTTKESPKKLTAKCHYRRAKLLCIMARYDEARADYVEFAHTMGELGTGISGEHTQLKEDIERGANTSEVSERRRKDELMRAVDARGFILRHPYRETFPLPPPNIRKPDFDPEQMALQFNTHDGRPSPRLPNPNLTPISIPMYIRAPYFKPDPTSTTPFSTREENPVSENDTVASIIEGLFFSVGGFYGRGKYDNREGIQSTVQHEKHGVVLVITSRGRILEIPRKMRIKDIVAGAQWPRPQSASEIPVLEDLREEPRERGDNIDGIEVAMGWFMEIYVIPKENLGEFLNKIETGLKDFGL